MKNSIAVLLLAIFAIVANAQTNSLWTDLGAVLGDAGLSSNPTNYFDAPFCGVSTTGNRLAAGDILGENINNNVGVVAGIDHLWFGGRVGSANIVSGGLTLKAPCHPLQFLGLTGWTSNLVATPYAIAMAATPLNGTGSANGGLGSIARAGASVDLTSWKGFKVSLTADYGNRTGSGGYNGNWVDFGFALGKRF
jgi:hypothetical protein